MNTEFRLLVALGMVVGALLGCREGSKERASEGQDEEGVVATPSRAHRNTRGEPVMTLDAPTQKLLGLQTASVVAATLAPERPAYGEVLDPTPLIGLAGAVATARVSLAASRQEHERLQTLFTQGQNASARALQAAEAAMNHDRIALNTAEATLVAAWGQAITQQPDLPGLIQALATHHRALVRLDLPVGETAGPTPSGARLAVPGGAPSVEAVFLGPAPTTDPQIQGEGFLLVVTNQLSHWVPGRAVSGFLRLSGEPQRGLLVPANAVVRSGGRAWVYVQTTATDFVRREITLDHALGQGWFVTNSVAEGDPVVVTGAQALLSEELKAEIKLGD